MDFRQQKDGTRKAARNKTERKTRKI